MRTDLHGEPPSSVSPQLKPHVKGESVKTENNPIQEGSPIVVLKSGLRGWVVDVQDDHAEVANRLGINRVHLEDLTLDLEHSVGRQHAATWVVQCIFDVRPETAILVACDPVVLALRWVTPTGYPAYLLWSRTSGQLRSRQGVDHPLRPIPNIPPRSTPESALEHLYRRYSP